MTNAPIRIVVILAVISLAGIIATQVYLVNQAVSSQEQQFNHSVQMALRNVVESVCEVTGVDVPTSDPIDQISANYFIVRTNNRIDLGALEYHLIAELEKREIDQDFEYGVYDCQTEKMVYGNFVNLSQASRNPNRPGNFPELDDYDYYFGVYFPMKKASLLWGIDWWKYTSLLTVLIIIFFGYAVFVILRQKRLSAIQRDFVNNITHEFKTPLSTLKVASTVVADPKSFEDKERVARYASIIKSESERLEAHVNQLLKSALLEQKENVDLEQIDVSTLINDLIERVEFDKRSIEVITKCDHTVVAVAEKYLLETVIYNLLDNARKYGGEEVRVTVKCEDQKAVIEIFDSGSGIPKEHQKNIFRKFYRVQSGDTHNVKGFGLGLHVVKNAVKMMNGSIELSCEEGCLFTIKLPHA